MSTVVKPHFTVEEEAVDAPASARPAPDHQAALRMLMLGLGALGQRTLHAIADMFCLLTVSSAFWLFTSIPDPGTNQLISLFGYCVFVLLANAIVRWKR